VRELEELSRDATLFHTDPRNSKERLSLAPVSEAESARCEGPASAIRERAIQLCKERGALVSSIEELNEVDSSLGFRV
jgi:hypothetical protein